MDTVVLIALILGFTNIVGSVIFGYLPRSRNEKLRSIEQELLRAYQDIREFQKLEHQLLIKCNISKMTARQSVDISAKSEPKRINKRITELESAVK